MPLCPKCGTALPADALFCNKCGTKINKMGETFPKAAAPNPLDCEIFATPSQIAQIGGGHQVREYIANQIKSFKNPKSSDKITQLLRFEDPSMRNLNVVPVTMFRPKPDGSIGKNFYNPLKRFFDWVMKYKSQLNLDALDIIEYLALTVNNYIIYDPTLPAALSIYFSSQFGQILKKYQNNPESIYTF